MKIAPFRIEQYYAVHEFTAAYMLSSSDAESVAVSDLLALEPDAAERLFAQRLGYTESVGAPELRAAIAAIYETTSPEDVLVVSAAEEGIFAAYHALLDPGDHVVVETPCYESALQVARSAGAEVTEWRRFAADGWAHDLDALERALRPETRLVYVNTPHNPTGTSMPRAVLDRVVELCAERGAWLFCDEVYRELEHDPADRLPGGVRPLRARVSLGSMSKTYGLPGLRLGWLASRDRDALQRIVDLKHYTTICSSAPSELLSALALRHRRGARGAEPRDRARESPLLDAFVERHAERFSWVRPTASPIGFPRFDGVDDTSGFCERLVADAGVLLLPGEVYDEPGHVRIGFGRSSMPEALALPRRLDRHAFLTLLSSRRNQGARFPNILPIHHVQTTRLPRGGALQWVTDRGSRRGSSGTASRGRPSSWAMQRRLHMRLPATWRSRIAPSPVSGGRHERRPDPRDRRDRGCRGNSA